MLCFQDNYTALHIAVESCKPAVVETLLGYGADVHVRGGKQKETALHIAARIPDGENSCMMQFDTFITKHTDST